MTTSELATLLNLPANTNQRNIASRAIRQHCAGGVELLAAKEWASNVANDARTALHDPSRFRYAAENTAKKDLAEITLTKLSEVQAALLAALETAHKLPSGTLTKYLRDRAAGE